MAGKCNKYFLEWHVALLPHRLQRKLLDNYIFNMDAQNFNFTLYPSWEKDQQPDTHRKSLCRIRLKSHEYLSFSTLIYINI